MATTSSMFMYSLSLKRPSSISHALVGQFTGTKDQQVVTACGSLLTMYSLDEARHLQPMYTHDVFGIIRSLQPFRLAGTHKDYMIIGSDSGRITIVELNNTTKKLQRVQLETFGKSGVRRVIPGEYLSVDPKGRACLIASVEKNKLVYVLNRNAQAELTISSPLEAHKPGVLVYHMIGLDVGFENPIFAALEVDYTDSDADPTGEAYQNIEKRLVYYELDLGLNHVVRKWSEAVDRTAHYMLYVPGGTDGPSGVLVCGEETITYLHHNQDAVRVLIPRRQAATEDSERKRRIVAGVTHKMRTGYFFLVQTEDGDLFKITMTLSKNDQDQLTGDIDYIDIKYFDSITVATSLVILKTGALFVASESGDSEYYLFESLGDDDDTEFLWTSRQFAESGYKPVYFTARSQRKHLALEQTLESLAPMTDCKVANLTGEDAPQIYTIQGSGARSSIKTIRNGLEVQQVVDSQLPNPPKAVWTTKLRQTDEDDAYIILSFSNATLVLSIGETVEEVTTSGFLTSAQTLAVQLIGDDTLVQVHPKGIRHIDSRSKSVEWPCPANRSIVAAATNQYQVAIGLNNGEIIYFEMDEEGNLQEYEDRAEMDGLIRSLSIGDVAQGQRHSKFLAVGCDDNTVRILSLDQDTCMESKSVQAVSAAPSQLHIMAMQEGNTTLPGTDRMPTTLYLHIGLESGVYLRTVLDEINGTLSDTRSRFLGPRPIKLSKVTIQDKTCVLALSSRPWLGYPHPQTGAFTLTPLNHHALQWASGFSSAHCRQGVVGIDQDFLRIIAIPDLNTNILQQSIPLTHTPRGFARHPDLPYFFVYETENGTMAKATRDQLAGATNGVNGTNGTSHHDEEDESDEAPVKPEAVLGYPRGVGHWSSCIELVDPLHQTIISTTHVQPNECILSMCVLHFASHPNDTYVCVGTSQNYTLSPRSSQANYITTFRVSPDNSALELLHKTTLEEPVHALCAFQGKLLASFGPHIRAYDIGLKQLLRKSQLLNALPNVITSFATQGSRIIASDIRESVTFIVYKPQENVFLPFADDTVARWSTCTTMVDYDTVAGGDKFGNLWLVRCPKQASDESDEDGAATHLSAAQGRGYLQGAPNKLNLMIHFYTQDIPTSVQKTQLVAGGKDVLVWSGLQGSIGVMIPFTAREDVDFFQSLEVQMRNVDPPLAGRDHLIYRGYYVPVKGVIDGDLCERFMLLSNDLKARVAGELDRDVREVEKRVLDFRARFAW